MTQIAIKICLSLIFLISTQTVTIGQDTISQQADQLHYMNDSKHWMIEIPLWIPGLRGALAYGDITLDIGGGGSGGGGGGGGDGNGFLETLFSSATKLEYFMMGRVRYTWEKLHIDGDIYGGKIDNSVTFNYDGQTLLETQIELIMARAFIGYYFIDHPFKSGQAGRLKSFATAGIQFTYAALDATLPEPINPIHVHNSWADPFMGVGVNYDLYRFSLGSSINLGFRGISSFNNWLFKTEARYRFGPRLSLELGWIMNGIGGTKTVSDEDLNLNISLNGPLAGLSFHF